MSEQKPTRKHGKHKSYTTTILFLVVFCLIFSVFVIPMGLANTLNTLMNTAYDLLVSTTLYIMAIAVIAGALSALFAEFGVIDLLNDLLSPLMKPLFGMPGASALGVVTTYLSDNPAILTLADDPEYRSYFKAYQIPALTNLGTSFGMGLIVTTFVLGLGHTAGEHVGLAALCGNLGAIVGSIISTRLMLRVTGRSLGKDAPAPILPEHKIKHIDEDAGGAIRIMNAIMDGGRKGVDLGLGIIPGVLIICTLVMMLTNGVPEGGVYTGAAYEGIGVLPKIAEKLNFILKPLFGFSSASGIAVPVTALGSAGAAMGMIPALLEKGLANCGDVAVFTAMCMCWSGYLSTHVSMMDVLKSTKFTGHAIISHTIGGICAGVAAHWLYVFMMLLV
ncbi:MAG: hypothetical protein IKV90_01415 [Clostridia bacterium]|nr:hypothetical protein [Clostridia bacterium]